MAGYNSRILIYAYMYCYLFLSIMIVVGAVPMNTSMEEEVFLFPFQSIRLGTGVDDTYITLSRAHTHVLLNDNTLLFCSICFRSWIT